MKYRIQEHYKQTDEIPNPGTLQTNRRNTEYRNTTNIDEITNTGVCSAPVFGISSVCL
jgi:hypothetical protein